MEQRRLIDRLLPWNTLPGRVVAKAKRDVLTALSPPRRSTRRTPTTNVSCPCGSLMEMFQDGVSVEEYVGRLANAEHHVICCPVCGYISYDPQPSEHDVAAFYDNALDGESHETYAYYDTAYGTPYVMARADFALRRLAEAQSVPIHGSIRLFDLGCGDGRVVDAFRRLGHDAWGADVGALQIERGRKLGNDRIDHGDMFEHLDSARGQGAFDLFYMFHVLEHLTDPAKALAHARRCAADETAFFIAVPNAWYVRLYVADLMGFNWHTFPAHLHFFSPPSLLKLLEGSGWKPLSAGAGSHNDPCPDALLMDLFRGATTDMFVSTDPFFHALESNLMSCDFWVLACADGAHSFQVDDEALSQVRMRDITPWIDLRRRRRSPNGID